MTYVCVSNHVIMDCADCGVREAHDASRRVLRPCRCAHEQVKHA